MMQHCTPDCSGALFPGPHARRACLSPTMALREGLPLAPEAVRCAVQGFDPRQGLPKVRAEWVARREARGDRAFTQVSRATG